MGGAAPRVEKAHDNTRRTPLAMADGLSLPACEVLGQPLLQAGDERRQGGARRGADGP